MASVRDSWMTRLPGEFRVAGHEFLFDDHGVAEALGSVTEFGHTHAAVAVVDAQNPDAPEAELGINAVRESVALDAVVLQIVVVSEICVDRKQLTVAFRF
jgi:hypothetical protein